jgi:Ca-activated chloride channel family protein
MEFLNPYAFLFLLIIPLLFLIKSKKLEFNKKIIIFYPFNRKKRFYVYLASFIFAVIALSEPVINKKNTKELVIKNANLVILLDASYPMKCTDIYPDRFDAAIEKLQKLFSFFKTQNISVILVKNSPYLLSPPTNDYNSVIYLLKHVNKKQLFNTDADFDLAFKAAKKLVSNPVILTVSYKSFNNAISYIVAKSPCDINGKIYPVSSKGIHFTYSNEDIKLLLKKINSLAKEERIKIHSFIYLFYYPLIIAIVLFFIASTSRRKFENNN